MILSLSSSELLYSASLCKLEYIFGIPDVLGGLDEGEKADAVQDAMRSLMAKKMISMDMDGSIAVCDELNTILRHCSFCEAMLSINVRFENGTDETRVIWKMQESLLQGIVHDDNYQFMYISDAEAHDIAKIFCEYGELSSDSETATIPYATLRKAKRYQKSDNVDAAVKCISAYGVSDELAVDIVLSLFEKTDFYMFSLLTPHGDSLSHEELSFSKGQYSYISMSQNVTDFKTNIVFTRTDTEEISSAVKGLFSKLFV